MRRVSRSRRSSSPCFSIGVRKTRPKRRASPSRPGHQKVELRPQLAEMVLDRRAGQAEPVARVEPAGERGRLAGRVLDRLRLVEHDEVPGAGSRRLGVARQQRVGRQHQIGIGDLRRSAAARSAPCSDSTRSSGREARGLGAPVRHHAGRADHEARPVEPARLLLDQDVRQGLHRLAEAHVVGEDRRPARSRRRNCSQSSPSR